MFMQIYNDKLLYNAKIRCLQIFVMYLNMRNYMCYPSKPFSSSINLPSSE